MKIDKELKQIAIDIHSNKIFTDRQVENSHDLIHIFLPLAFLTKKQNNDLKESSPGLIYEYMEKAIPICINGYPTFASLNTLTQDEFKKMISYYKNIEKTIKIL